MTLFLALALGVGCFKESKGQNCIVVEHISPTSATQDSKCRGHLIKVKFICVKVFVATLNLYRKEKLS